MKRVFGLILAVCMTSAFALPALGAAQPLQEVKTAAKHAQIATGMDTADKVHLHLHHVINCLVGPNGDGFDAKAGNPCEKMGAGAMQDVDLSDPLHAQLAEALGAAQQGLKEDDAPKAALLAGEAHSLLQSASDKLQQRQKNRQQRQSQNSQSMTKPAGG